MACFLSLIQIHKYDRLDILETNFRPGILEGESVQESETSLCYRGWRRSLLGLWEVTALQYWKLHGRMLWFCLTNAAQFGVFDPTQCSWSPAVSWALFSLDKLLLNFPRTQSHKLQSDLCLHVYEQRGQSLYQSTCGSRAMDKENTGLPVKAFMISFRKYDLLAVFSLPSREGCWLFFIFTLWAVGFMSWGILFFFNLNLIKVKRFGHRTFCSFCIRNRLLF